MIRPEDDSKQLPISLSLPRTPVLLPLRTLFCVCTVATAGQEGQPSLCMRLHVPRLDLFHIPVWSNLFDLQEVVFVLVADGNEDQDTAEGRKSGFHWLLLPTL